MQDTSNNISYVSGTGGMPTLATHTPGGSLAGYVNGFTGSCSGIGNSVQYNSRLQVCRITALNAGTLPSSCMDNVHLGNVLDLGYNLNLGNSDNGNVIAITNYRDTSRNQSFTYDQLNRLTSARNAGSDCTRKTANNGFAYWGNTYTYDAWGNLTNKTVMQNVNPPTCSGENLNAPVNTNNQLVGYGYDAAGNMVYDPTPPAKNYTYDAENRITGAVGYTYTYDANGNRVEKSNGTTGTIYWYMSPGIIVAESDLSGNVQHEYVFFNGKRVARKDLPSDAVSYYFSDELGTAAGITNSAGVITEDEDFYPWGGEIQFVNNDSNHYKYGAHERDSETGLDYMLARYYSNPLGRFLTPDWAGHPIEVPYANFGNPQSLNLYSYTKNNPTTFGDPDGHCCLDTVVNFTVGLLNAWGSDNLAGAGRMEQTTTAGKVGQFVGDLGATVQGAIETGVSGAGEGVGVTLDATGVGAVAGVRINAVSTAGLIHGSVTTATAGTNLMKDVTGGSSGSSTSEASESSADTVHGAQREAMRQEGIPTSQQPDSQVSTQAGRQYTYTVPKEGGGTQTKIVTRQHADQNHGTHVEAGSPKPNGQTDPSGRQRHTNDKTKVNVNQSN